jgi:hypothetical protein
MILDPHIRQVVNESGRREITIDMIAEAERRRANGVPVHFLLSAPIEFVNALNYLKELQELAYRDVGADLAHYRPSQEFMDHMNRQGEMMSEHLRNCLCEELWPSAGF